MSANVKILARLVREHLLRGSIVGIDDHHVVRRPLLYLQVGHRVHPLLLPLGIVEDDQHVVEVLEQLVALLEDLFLDGDPRGDDYLFYLF